MSSTVINKRPTTPKKQQKESIKENTSGQASLPPSVEGRVYAILICHVPKLRWLTKYQSLCRSVTIKITWWGENDTSATFKPHISGTSPDYRQPPNTTAKYYIRSELKQFTRYLIDAAELVIRVTDTETNRVLGNVKVQNLSTLSINNSIKGYHPIFSNKGDKLGELFISLRLFLPGPHDSSENLTALSYGSDTSDPPSRRNSIGVNDYNQNGHLENGLRTYTLNRPFNSIHSTEITIDQPHDLTSSKDAPPGMKKYKEIPTGKMVDELIEKANRLRHNMIKSSSQKITPVKKTNHHSKPTLINTKANISSLGNKSLDMLVDVIDPSINNENIYELLDLKSSVNVHDSNGSFLTDLDGLENEDSLIDDLLYGGRDHSRQTTSKTSTNKKKRSQNRSDSGRSPSPSLSHASRSSSRRRSLTRRRSSARSSDNDSASRVSGYSDVDDSGNENHAERLLSIERIQLLNYVRTARIRIDYLRLNNLYGRESPAYSSFGRTNKSKRALNYYIEYQFPVIVNYSTGHINEGSDAVKIASKRFESNNDITFSHLSTYPCLLNETNFKSWWRSLLIFKIYSRISGNSSPEQIGFAVLPFRNLLTADCLHLEEDLNVIDRTEINPNQRLSNKTVEKFSIGQLHLMLELHSDREDFKTELDRIQSIEQMKPKKLRVTKAKRTKKSTAHTRYPSSATKGFLSNESAIDLPDGLVLQIYLSIIEGRNISLTSNHNTNQPRNPYFVCRAFWNGEPITSVICWGSSTPKFNFEQKIPLLLTKTVLEKMHQNFVILELWDKKVTGPSDQLIGIIKIPLEQFYISFKDKTISRALLRAQYPVISTDSWLPIIDPFSMTVKSSGEIQILLAMGTADQITAVQVAHANDDSFPSLTHRNLPTKLSTQTLSSSSSLIEHQFEVMIENINSLRVFESMVWGESDCFIQYSFPNQQDESLTNTHSMKPFELRTIRTATTLCTSDPTFNDTNKFRYRLSSTDALHKYFYAACQSTTPIDAHIQFEVWSRFYHPNIRDQLLAKGKLSATKFCSMTTMMNEDHEEKSIQSFRIPLEIVGDDSKHEYHHYSSTSTYGGDLLLTVTYKRNIIRSDQMQRTANHISNDPSQVCISVELLRACGLKYAATIQAEHDTRFQYPSQVGLNTYAKLTCSFLSELESRSTRTITRSFIPEYNQTLDFPLSLTWSNHRNQQISLAEMLEHGDLKVDIYHQMDAKEKHSMDILLCSCQIPFKELLLRQTGIKGWHPLTSPDAVDHWLGGVELYIRFSQEDDRRRMINSARSLGWIEQNWIEEENSLNDEKDLGCSVKLSIDRIEIPLSLVNQLDKDRLNIFGQYRFYDKIPIITKRKRATTMKRDMLICQLDFNKEHLFLCTAPFFWYLREEKLEIQIWTSENDTYDYSQSFATSTEKLLGSIYLDLSSLLNKQRKSHRLSSILPILKQGTKDFHGACVHIQLAMDKPKDFNELRNRTHIDPPNDLELDSHLDTRYFNLINNDRALRTMTNNLFSVVISIEEAAHLPTIYSPKENLHRPPNPYVTFSTADSKQLYRTQILISTTKPQWNYQQLVQLSIEYLFNEKKVFLLKISHAESESISEENKTSTDKALGFVSIDLSPLLSGLHQISGWYNIIDTIGSVQGQLKISIVPQDDLLELKQMKYNIKTPSKRSISNDQSARSNNDSHKSMNSSIIDDDNHQASFLMNNLRRQLGELDIMTERLKTRYYSNSEICSTSRTNSTHRPSSTLTINTDTLPTDFLEHFTDTTKPSIHHDSNLPDALSMHNDHVCLAQELMAKANNLLQSSKDLFVESSIIERTST